VVKFGWIYQLSMSKSIAELNRITSDVIGAAIEVHRQLGPGLLESSYRECLCRELLLRGIAFEREKPLPLEYKGIHLGCGYRLDLLVAGCVVAEVKSIESLAPIHDAQLITYLRIGGWRVGLLINFNVAVLKSGIRRRILGYEEVDDVAPREEIK
jgi:GxxExxY protein